MAVKVERPMVGDRPAEPSFLVKMFDGFRNRHFRNLYLGNVMQFASMQMQLLVRGVLVYQLTGSFAALGLVSLANAIPGVTLAPFGGVLADRMSKKSIIQTCQAVSALNAGTMAVLAEMGILSFQHLIISAVVQGAVQAIMMPSRQSIISDIVGTDGLANAIALNSSGQNLMQLVGPGLGGLLLAVLNPGAVFGVMALLFLTAITFTLRLPNEPVFVSTMPRRRPRGGNPFRDLAEGLRYIGSDPTIRVLLIVNFSIVLLSMPYTMMLPGFVHEVLHKGAAEQGILMTLSGVGALGGSFTVASLGGKNRGRVLLIIATILGIGLTAFSISSSYVVTMPIMVLIGFASATRMSLGQVIIQSYTADEYRGRVMSVWVMQFSLVAFGTFGVGVLSEWLGPQLAIGGMAVTLVTLMTACFLFVPRIRTMQ